MGWWTRLYFDYTNFLMGTPLRLTWPGGVGIEQQPALLVHMFNEIEAGILKQMELDSAQQRH